MRWRCRGVYRSGLAADLSKGAGPDIGDGDIDSAESFFRGRGAKQIVFELAPWRFEQNPSPLPSKTTIAPGISEDGCAAYSDWQCASRGGPGPASPYNREVIAVSSRRPRLLRAPVFLGG